MTPSEKSRSTPYSQTVCRRAHSAAACGVAKPSPTLRGVEVDRAGVAEDVVPVGPEPWFAFHFRLFRCSSVVYNDNDGGQEFGIHPRDASPGGQGNRGHAATACPRLRRGSAVGVAADEVEERWLAVCRCGRMSAFLPEQPPSSRRTRCALPARPRAAVLPASPPWVRLFLASVEGPNPVRWRFCHAPCPGCAASASFGLQAARAPSSRSARSASPAGTRRPATRSRRRAGRGAGRRGAWAPLPGRPAPARLPLPPATRCFARTAGAVTNGESLPRGRRHDRDAEAPLAADANLRAVGRARRLARGVVRRRPVLVPDHPRLVLRAGAARVQPELHAVLGDPRRLSRRRLRCVLVLARDGGTRPGARRLRLLVACRDPTG